MSKIITTPDGYRKAMKNSIYLKIIKEEVEEGLITFTLEDNRNGKLWSRTMKE